MLFVFMKRMRTSIGGLFLFTLALAAGARPGGEIVLDFESGPPGQWPSSWDEQGATVALAWAPMKAKTEGSLTFFPRIGTDDQGVLCAMADEPIPVEVRGPRAARRVTVRFWASTGCAARLEALAADGTVLQVASVAEAPRRSDPAEPVPTFTLTVEAAEPVIAAIRFSGPREGEFLAADEIRWATE